MNDMCKKSNNVDLHVKNALFLLILSGMCLIFSLIVGITDKNTEECFITFYYALQSSLMAAAWSQLVEFPKYRPIPIVFFVIAGILLYKTEDPILTGLELGVMLGAVTSLFLLGWTNLYKSLCRSYHRRCK